MAARLRAAPRQERPADTVIAGATEDTTPRVGIVLSSFRGGEDHDGTKLEGLRNPASPSAILTADQIDEMVRRAIELGDTRRGGLPRMIEPEDWIVIQPQIVALRDARGPSAAGRVADLRVVRSLIHWLAGRGLGSRIMIAGGESLAADETFDPWASNWGGAFGGLTYRALVEDCSTRYPKVRFEITDLRRDRTMEMQGKRTGSGAHPVYQVPVTLLHCDRLISVAPLNLSANTGVWLTMGNCSGRYGRRFEAGEPAQVLVDLLSFHPPDYALLGGEWGLGGDGPYGEAAAPVHHNVMVAGANSVAVDAIGAAAMGRAPAAVRHLALAEKKGLGTIDLDLIWTRGNTIEEATRKFS